MRKNVLIRSTDLIDNPTARVPICLCLDVSGSMDGDPIRELNAGVKLFLEAIAEDEVARYSAEVCIVTFGGIENRPTLVTDFTGFSHMPQVPVFTAEGLTPMGEAVTLALDTLQARKEEYKANGVEYYQPWLVLMTDGANTGGSRIFDAAAERTSEEVNNRKLTIFPIGIGMGADMKALSAFSPRRDPLRLRNLCFREFFQWLSQSVATTSQSTPGESIPLDVSGIRGWGEL